MLARSVLRNMWLKWQLLILCALDPCIAYNYSYFNIYTGNLLGSGGSCLNRLLTEAGWTDSKFLVIHNSSLSFDRSAFLHTLDYFSWTLSDGVGAVLTGHTNLLIFTSNFESLRIIISNMDIYGMDARGEIIVCLTDLYADINHVQRASKGITNMFWKANKSSAVFFIRTGTNTLITTFQAFENNCEPSPIKLITSCNFGIFDIKHAEIFPKKLLNAFNCTMNCTWLTKDSYTLSFMGRVYKDKDAPVNLAGKELVNIMMKSANISLNIIDEVETESTNCHRTACISVIGFLPTPWKLKTMDILPGYQTNAFVFTYHEQKVHHHYWRNIFLPFKSEVWLCIFFTCTVASVNLLTWKYLGKKAQAPLSKMSLFEFLNAVFIDGRLKSTSLPSRISFFLWSAYAFYITTFYSSGLYGYLKTFDEINVLKTYKDLNRSGLLIGGTTGSRRFLNDPSSSNIMSLHDKYRIMTRDDAFRLLRNGTMAAPMLRTSVIFTNLLTSGWETHPYRMLTEEIMNFITPIYVSKGSPIITVIRPRIMDLHTFGFVSYWKSYYRHLARVRLLKKRETLNVEDMEVFTLRLEHFYSLFTLLLIGAIIASISFGIELYRSKSKKVNKNLVRNLSVLPKQRLFYRIKMKLR